MTDTIPWILIGVAALLVLGVVAVALAYKRKGQKQKTDYYTFFWMGLIWTIFGAAMSIFNFLMGEYPTLFFFLPMGVVFLALGLANRDKWKDRPEYTKNRKLVVALTGVMVLFLVAGLFAYIMFL